MSINNNNNKDAKMGEISSSVEEQVAELAEKMIEANLDTDSFQFGDSGKSRIWVSTDPEKISGTTYLMVKGKRFYFGSLRARG